MSEDVVETQILWDKEAQMFTTRISKKIYCILTVAILIIHC